MSAATDKARFYLEQCVPELRELESKKIFERKEIQAINRKRSDFEHKLNAPGSSPSDWARYLEYEFNLDTLRRKRAKRLGARVTKHAGPRRIFGLLERATQKFKGDLGLWMQYLDYAKKQRAFKRISTIWPNVVRLHSMNAELWVDAGRYFYDEQSDMPAARSYMQRGLRFCQRSTVLWYEYFRLELDQLARVSARAKSMGPVDLSKAGAGMGEGEEDEDQLMLPTATAEDGIRDEEGKEVISAEALEVLNKSPALSGAIPMAIFDAAMKALEPGPAADLASDMFDTAALYDMPSRQTILDHIAASISSFAPTSASAQIITIRLPTISIPVNTAMFARGLAASIAEMNKKLLDRSPESDRIHLLSARWIVALLRLENLDSGIAEALRATLVHIVTSYQELLSSASDLAKANSVTDSFKTAEEILKLSGSTEQDEQTHKLLDAIKERWPHKAQTLEAQQSIVVAS